MKAKITTRLLKQLKPADSPFEVFDTELPGFLIRVQPSGWMAYYLAYRNAKGRQRRFRLGPASDLSPVQARDLAVLRRGEIAAGKDVHADKVAARGESRRARSATLRVFLDEVYAPWVEQHHSQTSSTIKRIEAAFPELLDLSMPDLTVWALEKWRTARRKQGVAPSTLNRDVSALKGAISRAVEWGVIDEHPLAKLKPIKTDQRGRVRFLSSEEAQRLRDALEERDWGMKDARSRANAWRRERGYPEWQSLSEYRFADYLTPLVLVSLNTGIRRGEAFQLRWTDLDFKGRVLTVAGDRAKSGQTRHVPLNDEALGSLIAWRNQTTGDGLVWPGKGGAPLDNVKRAWGSVLRSAKVESFRWHDLRHTFASWLVMRGVPLNTVRDLLGHADIKTTLRYAHLAPDHRAEAVAALNSRSSAEA